MPVVAATVALKDFLVGNGGDSRPVHVVQSSVINQKTMRLSRGNGFTDRSQTRPDLA